MSDLVEEIVAAHRDVVRRGEGDAELIAVTVRRRYDAAPADVWDALTDPARLARWFGPVSGDLRLGGAFQVEGNAGGEVTECDPPHALAVTWGGPESVVRLRLDPDGAVTELVVEHTVPVAFAGSGAGALYVGPGWDVAVLGLSRFLRREAVDDPAAWEGTPAGQRFAAASIDAWAEVVAASGTAGPEELAGAVGAARAQFTPDDPPA
ncbi:SRPBCC family protein [Modestobacter muralis]|uniref:SRPBCC family protein n=1 Tax=Modestobacter muralis TaxID=1608614 RepID=A0A6P0H6Z9_9ACTN|nr:SRPBCC family protein [Modestobacter muralis]NEK93227.1 SRPBCC family protein [Modestobacter muralis]NEN49994.1 SRPBCC family protein [Modestobacter muralis]